jgi:hypothetical protein
MLRFNCEVPADGDYLLNVYYLSYQSRNLQISIGNRNYTLTCPSVSTWDNIADEGRATLKLNLKGGKNTCILTNPNGAAPNIDKIAFTMVLEQQDGKVTLNADNAGEWSSGSVAWQCDAPQAGHYRAEVFYKGDENRNVYLAVNDADAVMTVFAATGETEARRPFFLTLQEGTNSLLFSSVPKLPELQRVELSFLAAVPDVLEAEFASTTGQVTVASDANASGGRYLSYIGNGADNMATFRFDAPVGGKYDLTVTYFTAQKRQMYVRVNNGAKVNASFESTGGWDASTAATKTVTVTLKTGSNIISLGSDSGWAPYIDKIALSLSGDDGVTTPTLHGLLDSGWHTLGGISLGAPTTSGMYICQNKKYLVRK